MAILVDTGPLLALADQRDADHERVRRWWEGQNDLLVVPVTVLPEVSYFLATRLGSEAETRFLETLLAGELRVEPFLPSDLPRCVELVRTYADSGLGFVDASLVAMAERLNITRLLTLDQRHFAAVRPRHCPTFALLPG